MLILPELIIDLSILKHSVFLFLSFCLLIFFKDFFCRYALVTNHFQFVFIFLEFHFISFPLSLSPSISFQFIFILFPDFIYYCCFLSHIFISIWNKKQKEMVFEMNNGFGCCVCVCVYQQTAPWKLNAISLKQIALSHLLLIAAMYIWCWTIFLSFLLCYLEGCEMEINLNDYGTCVCMNLILIWFYLWGDLNTHTHTHTHSNSLFNL